MRDRVLAAAAPLEGGEVSFLRGPAEAFEDVENRGVTEIGVACDREQSIVDRDVSNLGIGRGGACGSK
jgi:hypothetical protein